MMHMLIYTNLIPSIFLAFINCPKEWRKGCNISMQTEILVFENTNCAKAQSYVCISSTT